jgi:hypothetical protein
VAAGGAILRIDLYGTGFSVPLDQVLGTSADAGPALPADHRLVKGRFPPQDMDRRPFEVDDSFMFQGTPHFATMTTRTSIRYGHQRLQHRFPLIRQGSCTLTPLYHILKQSKALR